MIEHRFTAAAETYDLHSQPQRALAERLLNALPALLPGRILEAGAGTGQVTRLLLERFPEVRIDALDSAPGMVRVGQDRFAGESRVQWILGDMSEYCGDAPYSMVLSNAALQWVADLPSVLLRLSRQLEAGGMLAIGLMLSGTLEELHAVRRLVAPHKMGTFHLPVWDAVQDAMQQTGLSLIAMDHAFDRVSYASAAAFLRILHEQGVTGGHRWDGFRPLTRTELRRLTEVYQETYACNGGVVATYEHGVMIARKD